MQFRYWGANNCGYKCTIQCTSEEMSNKAIEMKNLMWLACTAQAHKIFNRSKGLVCIKYFSMENVSSFQEDMKAKYQESEIMKARWIKPRSEDHTAWLLTFNSDTLPETINIPGEQIFTKVYPYKDKPIICRKCQQYSHSIKYC